MPRILAVLLAGLWLAGCSKEHPTLLAPQPGPASLLVRTHPGSASVVIDGYAIAEPTPLTIRTTVGNHDVRCSLTGYADTTYHIRLNVMPDTLADSIVVTLRPLAGTPRAFESWPIPDHPGPFDVGPDGTLFITVGRYGAAGVDAYSPSGSLLWSWPYTLLFSPSRMITDSANNVYAGTQKFSAAGEYLYRLSPVNPNYYDLALGPGDSIYAYCPTGILVYGPSNGTAVREIPLHKPVVVGLDGMLYAAGTADPNDGLSRPSRRIVKYSANGDSIATWAVTRAGAMDVGPDGNLYILESPTTYSPDKTPGLIEEFSPDGILLARWGVERGGTATDYMGLAVAPNLDLFTVDRGGYRIVRWRR